MNDGIVATFDPRDPWGRYRERVESALASCADYLGRLQRSLSGELPSSDRFYFREKAHALREAAATLVRRCFEVERWLQECGAEWSYERQGERYLAECALPAGHGGGHSESPTWTPLERAKSLGDALSEKASAVADRLAWLAVLELTDKVAFVAPDPTPVDELRVEVRELLRLGGELAQAVQNVHRTSCRARSREHDPSDRVVGKGTIKPARVRRAQWASRTT